MVIFIFRLSEMVPEFVVNIEEPLVLVFRIKGLSFKFVGASMGWTVNGWWKMRGSRLTHVQKWFKRYVLM